MKFRLFTVCIVLASLLLVVGCGDHEGKVVRRSGVQQDISMVSEQNAKMNAAFVEARKTVPQFIAALQNRKSTQGKFTVKVKVSDANTVEYMWLKNLTYDGASFHGQLMDDPYDTQGYHMGQDMTVPATEISDWLYFENGKMVGGYTERVLTEMGAK